MNCLNYRNVDYYYVVGNHVEIKLGSPIKIKKSNGYQLLKRNDHETSKVRKQVLQSNEMTLNKDKSNQK